MAKGSRGGRRAGGVGKIISTGERPVNAAKAGVAFNKQDKEMQDSISDGLKMTDVMKNAVKKGQSNIFDSNTWSLPKPYAKGVDKIKVEWRVKDGKLVYSAKKGRKTVLKEGTKEQAANRVAQWYNEAMPILKQRFYGR